MAARKLGKYERMWRTRRQNASAKLAKLGLSPLEGGTKHLKPDAKMGGYMYTIPIGMECTKDAPPAFQSAPESFVIVTDSLGRGVMVNTRDIMRAAEVIKQTGYVE